MSAFNSVIAEMKRPSRVQLFVLLGLIFSTRLVAAAVIWVINGPLGFWSMDTDTYLRPATYLLQGSFSNGAGPELMRTPGYPLLLLPALASHHPVVVAVFENVLLTVASAWLIWEIAGAVTPFTRARFWALLFYCFEPVGFLYSTKILSDLLFSTQLLLFLWLMVLFLRHPTYLRLMTSALVLGTATYTRPVSLFLGLWLVPFFLFFPKRLSWSERIPMALVFPLVFMMTLAPWVVRNARVADYKGFSSISDVSFYFYAAAAVNARLDHKDFAQIQAEMGWNNPEQYFYIHPEQRNWTQAQVLRYERTEARQIISHHLLSYAAIHLRGCAVVMLDPAVTEIMKLMRQYPEQGGLLSRGIDQGLIQAALWLVRKYPAAAIALPLLGSQLLFYYSFGLIGLRWLTVESSALFVFVAAYLVLASGSSLAVARYRMPIMPLVCVTAGAGLARWRTERRTLSPADVGDNGLHSTSA